MVAEYNRGDEREKKRAITRKTVEEQAAAIALIRCDQRQQRRRRRRPQVPRKGRRQGMRDGEHGCRNAGPVGLQRLDYHRSLELGGWRFYSILFYYDR